MKNKIKVGFIINYRLEGWLGVTNYYKNLFKIIKHNKNNLEVIVLTDYLMTKKEDREFEGIKIIKSNIFDRKSKIKKIFNLFSIFIFGKNLILDNFLENNDIRIISHTNFTGRNSNVPSLKWFPDFQEYKFPKNFSLRQKIARNLDIYLSSNHASKILISSKSVQNDLKKINLKAFKNSKILYHTTYIDKKIKFLSLNELKKKFNLRSKFFYLPNHFWKHKNHIVVYKAIKELKKKKKNILVITTGNKSDYRFPKHFSNLENYIKKEKLEKNIVHLGIVSLNNVFSLIKNSLATINPSFFEGWGNTLEHAINLNKLAIVSNINVHRERKCENKILFDPKDFKKLEKIMIKIIDKKKILKKNVDKKIEYNNFLKNYSAIINETIKLKKFN